MPVFLALGRYDFFVRYELWEHLRQEFANLTLHLFERSGHSPMLEEKAVFDEKVIAWLETSARAQE
jgi:proline iminopeptidase